MSAVETSGPQLSRPGGSGGRPPNKPETLKPPPVKPPPPPPPPPKKCAADPAAHRAAKVREVLAAAGTPTREQLDRLWQLLGPPRSTRKTSTAA